MRAGAVGETRRDDATQSEPEPERLLTAKEVARWLATSPATLCRWRQAGTGPRWVALGDASPRYRRDDVASWLDEQASR